MGWIKEKKILFFVIIGVLVASAIGVGLWWYNSSQAAKTPERQYEITFLKEVAPNVESVISLDELAKKLDKVEIVYHQYSSKESTTIIKYYIKFKGKDGYYEVLVPSYFLVPAGLTQYSLLTYFSYMGEGGPKVYPISTDPKLPVGKEYIIMSLLFFVALVLVFYLLSRQVLGGKFLQVAKERYMGEKISFGDIAGVEEAKKELREVVDFVQNNSQYEQLNARVPKGVLLIGPPGCGKTLMAKAVANELKSSFLAINGSEFIEMFVGVGASRIRYLFKEAKKIARKTGRCVVFIDEIDAIGGKRGSPLTSADNEQHRTTNEIMVQMDGIGSGKGILVIAATNREDVLDEAFKRPGRFDRKIAVDYPDAKGREAILKVHTKDKPLAEDIDFSELARSIPLGSSGADIANIVNEAAIYAGSQGKTKISKEDFQYARDKIRLGLEKRGDVITEEEKKIYAYHEASHALVAAILPRIPPLGKVSIVRRGYTHGVVEILPEKDKYIKTKAEIFDYITLALASIAGEEEIFGPDGVTTGAQNDLEQATRLAANMVYSYGMDKNFGLVSLRAIFETNQPPPITEALLEAVNQINLEAKNKATEIIKANRKKLDALAIILIEKEDIDGKTAKKIIDEN